MPQNTTHTYTTRPDIEARINGLKQALAATDYKAIKAFEGHPGATWEQDSASREAWRSEVDALQAALAALPPDDGEAQ
jgi:hypothetical protein